MSKEKPADDFDHPDAWRNEGDPDRYLAVSFQEELDWVVLEAFKAAAYALYHHDLSPEQRRKHLAQFEHTIKRAVVRAALDLRLEDLEKAQQRHASSEGRK